MLNISQRELFWTINLIHIKLHVRKRRLLDGCQKCIISSSSVLQHVKLLVPTAFAVINTYQSALGRGGLWPVLLNLLTATDVFSSLSYPYPTKLGRYNMFLITL
jgi:hypothetical protein